MPGAVAANQTVWIVFELNQADLFVIVELMTTVIAGVALIAELAPDLAETLVIGEHIDGNCRNDILPGYGFDDNHFSVVLLIILDN